ncbi:S1 family serine peptidase [Enterovibrio paralichthyis]|uniref:S1 family serine peptidase n=1 Tax=Enterovibrio paralichthyis TaxID=2853805 RepID=UPI002103D95F|nr:serine protease [Enterovibrio paralichthyis]
MKSMKGIALLVLGAAGIAQAAERAPRVVGGSDALISDAPWQAYVRIGSAYCGGVVIANRWILTAAHCLDTAGDNDAFDLASANDVSVYTGTAEINGVGFADFQSSVAAIYANSNYDKTTFSNDIALIKLSTDIHANASAVQLADLTVQADVDATANLSNNDLQLTGWGFTNANRTGYTDTLQKAALSTVSDATCASDWGTTVSGVSNYQKKYFCAEAPGKGACNGDSGGPLVWFDPSRAGDADGGATLVGLVSFGIDAQCASSSFPDVYTQVSNYSSWISTCQAGNCAAETSNVTIFSKSDGGGGGFGSMTLGFLLLAFLRRFLPIPVGRATRQ